MKSVLPKYLAMRLGLAVLIATAVLLSPGIASEKMRSFTMQPFDSTALEKSDITITVVFDNMSRNSDLETQWGFACVIQGLGQTILFDTGCHGTTLLRNMEKLGFDPKQIAMVFLSHSHWDHVGGLEAFLAVNPHVHVYLLDSFTDEFAKKFTQDGIAFTAISEPSPILKGVHSTGTMGGAIREQSLIIRSPRGLVVITGCAHPGIVDIVKKARALLNEEVLLVLGGFHLRDLSVVQVQTIISELKTLGVRYVAPSHCTGEEAIRLFETGYKDHFIASGAGQIFRIHDLE